MTGMVGNPQKMPDQSGHPTTGPDGAAETEGFRTETQHFEQGQLLVGPQLGGSSRMRNTAKRFDASFATATQPLADRTFGNPQRLSDGALFPALLLERPGSKTTAFEPIVRR